MSIQNVRKFYGLVEKNKMLKGEMSKIDAGLSKKQITPKDLSNIVGKKIIPLAKKNNCDFTEKDLFSYFEERAKKLGIEDLMQVSGGISQRTAGIGLGAIMLLGLGGTAAMNLLKGQSNTGEMTSVSQSANNKEKSQKGNRVEAYPGAKSGSVRKAAPIAEKAEKIERVRQKAPDSVLDTAPDGAKRETAKTQKGQGGAMLVQQPSSKVGGLTKSVPMTKNIRSAQKLTPMTEDRGKGTLERQPSSRVGELTSETVVVDDKKTVLENVEQIAEVEEFTSGTMVVDEEKTVVEDVVKGGEQKVEELTPKNRAVEDEKTKNIDKVKRTKVKNNEQESPQMSALKDKLAKDEAKLNELKNKGAELSKEKENLTNEINKLKKEIDSAKTDLDETNKGMANKKLKMYGINEDIKGKKEALANLNKLCTEKEKLLKENTNAIIANNKEVAGAEKAAKNSKDAVDKQIKQDKENKERNIEVAATKEICCKTMDNVKARIAEVTRVQELTQEEVDVKAKSNQKKVNKEVDKAIKTAEKLVKCENAIYKLAEKYSLQKNAISGQSKKIDQLNKDIQTNANEKNLIQQRDKLIKDLNSKLNDKNKDQNIIKTKIEDYIKLANKYIEDTNGLVEAKIKEELAQGADYVVEKLQKNPEMVAELAKANKNNLKETLAKYGQNFVMEGATVLQALGASLLLSDIASGYFGENYDPGKGIGDRLANGADAIIELGIKGKDLVASKVPQWVNATSAKLTQLIGAKSNAPQNELAEILPDTMCGLNDGPKSGIFSSIANNLSHATAGTVAAAKKLGTNFWNKTLSIFSKNNNPQNGGIISQGLPLPSLGMSQQNDEMHHKILSLLNNEGTETGLALYTGQQNDNTENGFTN